MVTFPAHTEFSYGQDRYAEGTFHKYIFADTSSLIVHDGHNVQRPFSSNYTSKDTIKLFDNEVIRYSGKSDGFFLSKIFIPNQELQ